MELKSNATKPEIKKALDMVEADKTLLQTEIKKLKKEQEKKDALFAEQTSQVAGMRDLLLQLQSSVIASKEQNSNKKLEESVAVRSNLIGKHNVKIDRDSWVTFGYTGAVEDLSIVDVRSMLKTGKNKELFLNGILIFEDEEDYKTFRIKPRILLTDEYIIDLFKTEEVKDFTKELKRITSNKKIPSVVHNLVFRSGLLYKDGKLVNPSYAIMEEFKKYFGVGLLDLNVQLLDE